MRHVILYFLLLSSSLSWAQTGIVKGRVFNDENKQPYFDITVTIPQAKTMSITDADGNFSFGNIPYGNYEIIFSLDGTELDKTAVQVGKTVNILEPVYLTPPTSSQTNNYTLDNSASNFEESGNQDDNSVSSGNQNISSVLNASRDAYLSAATFGWGQYFYRMRGYENDNNVLYLNGVPMNDLEEGGVFFNSWSGLNDVFRGRSLSLGLAPTDYNFGGMGLNTSLDATASNQRKGTRLTYTATNRSYRNRIMLTHNSGLMKNGWAYSFSVSRRWAQQGQIKGTFYDALAYYAAVERRFKRQGFNFMVVGSQIRRGKSGPASEEAFDLAGTHYYNPYWGYQNGEIRNSRILNSHSPLFILTHDYKVSEKTLINSSISFQSGETANTGIDWYNSADPRPDYYRYMPSYIDSPGITQEAYDRIKANPDEYMQIQWDKMYEANYLSKKGGYGRSMYIVNENVEASRKWNGAVNLESVVNDHVMVYSGLQVQSQVNHNFQRVADLLGGDYWLNINQFASRQFPGLANADKLNVNDANIARKVGDTYGYDYNIHFFKSALFGQAVMTYNKIDVFAAAELGYTSFHRVGNYLNGLYPSNSFGKSAVNNFLTWRTKGGATYKINGRNYIYVNGSIGTRAPFVDNVIVSPRTRNLMISNPQQEEYNSLEAGYLLRSPNVKARLTAFLSNINNASDIKRYYGDDSASFVNMAMQGINKRYMGIEAGAEIKLSPSFSVNLAAAFTQAYYTSRPYINIYSDNDTVQLQQSGNNASDTIFMKNFYLPAGPQTAMQLAFRYNSKRYWFFTASLNYMANNWMDFTPTRRTKDAVDLLKYPSDEWTSVVAQRRIPSFYTIDLFGGKSFKVNKYLPKAGSNTYLNLNLGVTNLLNNQNIMLYGFENMRFNRQNPDWFPSKGAYALGIQYFINATLRF